MDIIYALERSKKLEQNYCDQYSFLRFIIILLELSWEPMKNLRLFSDFIYHS